MTRCAYIFLDEAGNFDFSANGTRYFALASVSMRRPFPAFNALDDYKHDCLEAGRNLEHFHCSHYGLQVADYCCWAVFRKWQRGEGVWYDRIKPAVYKEFEILRGEMGG